MKPRTKLQKEIVVIRGKLRPLTDKQKEWSISRCYTEKERGYARNIYRYFVISSRCKDWQVVRFFQIRKRKQDYPIIEPIRLWFNADGHMEIEAMNKMGLTTCLDAWVENSELSFKKLPLSYKDYTIMLPISASKVTSTLPILKRNGLKRGFHDMQPRDVIDGLLKNNLFETLWKCKQFSLLKAITYNWNMTFENKSKVAAIKVALHHNYKITDGRMWLDMIGMLIKAHKDIRNPKYICPNDLQAAHDKALILSKRQDEIDAQKRNKQRLLEDKKAIQRYNTTRKCFMRLVLTDGTIVIKVLPTVKSIMQEVEAMHHCVFANEYYKRLDSLLLTAKVNDERAETIEVDLKRYEVLQSRGVCNKNSEYHDRIVNLVNENMNVIRKFNKVV